MLKRHRFRAALVAASLAAVPITVADSSPASAAGCVWAWRDTNGNNPNRTFTISHNSPCRDLNAKRPTVTQHYRGEYLSNGVWRIGAVGWVHMVRNNNANRVLISNIRNGTTVRVTGAAHNAWLLVGT